MEDTNNIENITFTEKLKNFFIHPIQIFAQYNKKRFYALKLLIILIITAMYGAVQSIMAKPYLQKYYDDLTKNMSSDQASIVKSTTSVISSIPVIIITTIIIALITIFIASFVYMLFIKAAKGKIKYGQVVSIYTTAYMATVIGLIIKILYMLISKKPMNISAQTNPNYINTILKSYDIFTIWQWVLMAIGISTVAKISKKKSAIIVIILALILICIVVVPLMLKK
ncbi:Yip1 domain-containing protein [Clostridium pasteurianum DSM 525 = ATCC 6013]|uniref:Yip1 domain-containing protein n=1 Tax=Clostridium pasteurianum DSM 525 = ATCC 6013 TaxID=1262449 RepID=A0A0H3JBI9_CLOPA|nr:Yip1 family protein [Clostridium pasteurianum]AJA49810.1 Yip1 domain-containing protein [Clostridium pasteurianum DSM 525 = ATCC 6013]AJA53798.1 Yip1 domain-containing protein [Clostridium pasteurianum DSM 525 = ATCC 6013]AOZ76957.1 hypothetical protein AQ983_18350 [Clostridium pasteurianum DSM 525 = ATCC 6013]AOZ80754.1 hypothetical protein AQ984_18345 [Clostridium pasteurianum]ELP57770.1 hypothetical protein F502_17437 [Clostridium pasteurianum DSM 525 = ATCC 6013]